MTDADIQRLQQDVADIKRALWDLYRMTKEEESRNYKFAGLASNVETEFLTLWQRLSTP
jgi:hypothetical protein